jgi:hypothetical protein
MVDQAIPVPALHQQVSIRVKAGLIICSAQHEVEGC